MNKKELARQMKLAGKGDGAAACRLGDAYREGVGVEQSWEEAFRWYTLGAHAGDAEAQNNLGTLYLEGFYVPEDDKAAAHWYRLSAEQGADVAQYNLGMRYLHGQGVPVDFAKAKVWLERSAEQGYNLANTEIGIMYLFGEGCPPDRKKAKDYLIMAAQNGDERAFFHLDKMIPELEASVFQGDIDLVLQLPWLYYRGLGGKDCKAKAWAWMLWLDAQGPLPGGMGCQDIEDFTNMGRMLRHSGNGESDMQHGHELFEMMKREHAMPQYPTYEEIIADLVEVETPRSSKDMRIENWRQACASDASDVMQRPKHKRGQCVIVEVGAEGGGFTLFGKKQQGKWTFWSELNDWTPTLLDEPAIHRRSEEAKTWDAAIALMNKHCKHWMDLSPTQVHPEFRAKIWELVERRNIVSKLIGCEEVAL